MARQQHTVALQIPPEQAVEICRVALEEMGLPITEDEAWHLAGKEKFKPTSSSWPVRLAIDIHSDTLGATQVAIDGKIGGVGQSPNLKQRIEAFERKIRAGAGDPEAARLEAIASGSADIQDLARAGVVGSVGKKALEEIVRTCRGGEQPEFIIGAGMAGALAAFSDRCVIVKKGGLTSFMAGATGGGRTTTFHYVDVMAVEYNSGWVSGTLEILTPSHDAGRAQDYWRMSGTSGGGTSAWELPNVLPLPKDLYETARPHIKKLQAMIAGAKRPPTQAATPAGDISSQLARLSELHAQGALDDDEFQAAKRSVLHPDDAG